MIVAETNRVPPGTEEAAHRALRAALLELGVQPTPAMPGSVRFYSPETVDEVMWAGENAGEREWSHATLPDSSAAHVAAGVLWLPAAIATLKTIAAMVNAEVFSHRAIN